MGGGEGSGKGPPGELSSGKGPLRLPQSRAEATRCCFQQGARVRGARAGRRTATGRPLRRAGELGRRGRQQGPRGCERRRPGPAPARACRDPLGGFLPARCCGETERDGSQGPQGPCQSWTNLSPAVGGVRSPQASCSFWGQAQGLRPSVCPHRSAEPRGH